MNMLQQRVKNNFSFSLTAFKNRYHRVLEMGDASLSISLQPGAMRLHVIESLTTLSKCLGCYHRRQEIRKWYPTSLHLR